MARRSLKKAAKPVTPGKRVGTKKRDMRWETPDGTVWASRFEYEVYDGIKRQLGGSAVRRCTKEDSLAFTSDVKSAECAKCGSAEVVQRRTATSDLLVNPTQAAGRNHDERAGYFIEVKGYLRAEQRRLLRCLVKSHPDMPLRLVVEKDYAVSKSRTLGQWIDSFLKKPWCVWSGQLPKEWL